MSVTATPIETGASATFADGEGSNSMNINRNILYAIIGALVVAGAVIGYQLYERRNKATIEINVDPGGVSIEKR